MGRTKESNFVLSIKTPIENPPNSTFIHRFSYMKGLENYTYSGEGVRTPKNDKAWRVDPDLSLDERPIRPTTIERLDKLIDKVHDSLRLDKKQLKI